MRRKQRKHKGGIGHMVEGKQERREKKIIQFLINRKIKRHTLRTGWADALERPFEELFLNHT